MACFIVPATEAVVTSIIAKTAEKKEKREGIAEVHSEKISDMFRRLSGFLWGGSALLAFEHLWHGEIVPFFPFVTAAENPQDLAKMFHEMGTVGVGMAVLVTTVWGVITLASHRILKREDKKIPAQKEIG